MWPVSEKFLQAARGSHTRVSRATLQRGGVVLGRVGVTGGSITADDGNAVERSGSLTVIDTEGVVGDLAVRTAQDPLSPFGSEVVIESGIRFEDGSEEWVPMGVFGIWNVATARSKGEHVYTLSIYDRAKSVQGSSSSAIAVRGGLSLPDAIRRLVTARRADAVFRFPQTGHTLLPLFFDDQADLWEEARKTAKAGGFRATFDREGYCTLLPLALQVNETRVQTYRENDDNCVISLSRTLNGEDIVNVVVVVGSHSNLASPVRAEAADTNPASLTFAGGALGRRVKKISSEKVASNEMALEMARTELSRLIGASETVTLDLLPNAALDIGDVIEVDSPEAGILNRRFVISRIEFPLDVDGTMGVTARRSIFTSDNRFISEEALP